jgi:hypothetical protein
VAGVAASPSGSEIWAACLNDLRVVNTTTLSVTHVITDHAQGLYQVALLDFGASYVVASMAYASPAQPGGYAVIGAHTYSIVSTSNVGDLRGVSCLTNGDDCFVAGQGTNQLYWIHNGSLYDQFSASTFGNCQTPFGAAAFFTTTMGGENFLDVSCKGNDGVARYGIPTGMNWYSSCQPHGYSCVYQGTTSVRTPLGIRIVH